MPVPQLVVQGEYNCTWNVEENSSAAEIMKVIALGMNVLLQNNATKLIFIPCFKSFLLKMTKLCAGKARNAITINIKENN